MNAKINDSIQHSPVVHTFPILIRALKDGTKCVFVLNSLNMEKQTIEMWPADSNSNETYTVSLEAYRGSVAVSDADEAYIMDQFGKINNIVYGLVLRKRLFKVSPLHVSVAKAAAETVQDKEPPFDKEAFIEKIILAVTTALREAIKD